MATFLHRLGRFAFRRRLLVTVLWAVLLIAVGAGAATLSGQMTNNYSMPGTESQQAIDRLSDTFPEASADGATARVVIAAPEGAKVTDPTNAQALQATVGELQDLPHVAQVADPIKSRTISPGQDLALIQVNYDVPNYELTDSDRDALKRAASPAKDADLRVEFGGDALQAIPVVGSTEIVGVAVAAVVLLITLGSIVAAGLPLLTALTGVGIGMAGISVLSGFVDLNANTPVLAMMIGLAVGIDYALFVLSRYRHERAQGHRGDEAAGRAVGTAGSAVVFAGLTVLIALAGLSVVGIPILTQMGLAAAATVTIAVLVATTLLPAVLGFAGAQVLSRRARSQTGHAHVDSAAQTGLGERWVRFVSHRRATVLITAVVGLAVLSAPAAGLRLGMPDDSTAAPETTQRQAYDLISDGFGEGANGPLLVVANTEDTDQPQQAARQIMQRVAGLDDVTQVTPPRLNRAGDTALLTVVPKTGPSDEQTKQLVHDIREQNGALQQATGASVTVTGATAMNIDISQKLSDALVPYLALIVGLAFVLLMLVFRSVVVPFKATIGFLGSIAATLGAVVAVFQWGWFDDTMDIGGTGPIISLLPILLIGVLFGLAMDYQVFLVTRMREEHTRGSRPDEAVVGGFRHGARVVVAAAMIMTSVFAGFVFAEDTLIQSIGFALAFGVLMDAFVVRMTIVPAVMSLLGRSAWWLPRRLNQVLPNLDIEGEQLHAIDHSHDTGDVGETGDTGNTGDTGDTGEPVPTPEAARR